MFLPSLPGSGRQPNRPFLALVFLETRPKSASLEPLNGFLAYLEPKLWLENLQFLEKNEIVAKWV